MPDRFSQVRRVGILRVPAAIGVHRTPDMRASLEHEQHPVGQLEHLEGKRRLVEPRDTRRQASRFGIVLLQVGQALVVDSFSAHGWNGTSTIFSTGVRSGAPGPTPAIFSITLGFHEPLPLPRSGFPSGSRGVGPALPFSAGSGILPATIRASPFEGSACPRATIEAQAHDSVKERIQPALFTWPPLLTAATADRKRLGRRMLARAGELRGSGGIHAPDPGTSRPRCATTSRTRHRVSGRGDVRRVS